MPILRRKWKVARHPRPCYYRRMGREGGLAVLKKYGVQHFRELGKRGFESFKNRYFAGSTEEAMNYLHLQATERQINGLVEKQMAETGEKCVELPVLMEPDQDAFFDQPSTRWRDYVTAGRNGKRR